MPRHAVPPALTRQRETLAWELSAKGMIERRIADELEQAGLGRVTQQAVSAMLLRVEARVLKETAERSEGIKARQTAALRHIHDEAMQAWERSKGADKSITKRLDTRASADGQQAGAEQVTTQIREQDGDPRFLDQARSALADMRKIWGVDAAERRKIEGDPKHPLVMEVRETIVRTREEARAALSDLPQAG